MRQTSKLGMDTLRETSRTARGCQRMITLNQIKTDRNEQTISQLLSVFVVTIKSNLEYLSTIHALRSAEFLLKYSHVYIHIHTTHIHTKVLPPSDKKYGYWCRQHLTQLYTFFSHVFFLVTICIPFISYKRLTDSATKLTICALLSVFNMLLKFHYNRTTITYSFIGNKSRLKFYSLRFHIVISIVTTCKQSKVQAQ